MSVSRCRHTFIDQVPMAPWHRCSFCLLQILPLVKAKYCANCDGYLHEECYQTIMKQMSEVAEAMDSGDYTFSRTPPSRTAAAATTCTSKKTTETVVAAAAEAGALPLRSPSCEPPATVIETTTTTTTTPTPETTATAAAVSLPSPETTAREIGEATRPPPLAEVGPTVAAVHENNDNAAAAPVAAADWQESFSQYMEEQKRALRALFSPTTAATNTAASHTETPTAEPSFSFLAFGSSTEKTPTTITYDNNNNNKDNNNNASSSFSPPPPASTAATTSRDRSSSTTSPSSHTLVPGKPHRCRPHELFPQEYYFPTKCDDCINDKDDVTKKHLMDMAAATLQNNNNNNAQPQKRWHETSYMAFGTEGFHCRKCGFNIHAQCLRVCYVDRRDAYVVVQPAAHLMEGQARALRGDAMPTTPTTGGGDSIYEGETLIAALQRFFTANSPQAPTAPSSATTTTTTKQEKKTEPWKGAEEKDDEASTTRSAWVDRGKYLLSAYFNGGTSGADPNVFAILQALFALLDTLLRRHPVLLANTSSVLNPLRLRRISLEHGALYHLTCGTLQTVGLHTTAVRAPLSSIQLFQQHQQQQGQEQQPQQKAATTTATTTHTTTTSTPSTSTSTTTTTKVTVGVRDNNTILLESIRDALRYATAVYGAPYSTGQLSSVVSATMLFTTNREATGRLTRQENETAVTDILALPPSALRASRWSHAATVPTYILLVDHLSSHIVVSFRGTLSDTDVLTDVCAVGEAFCGGRAHQGAARCVQYLFDQYDKKQQQKQQQQKEKDAEDEKEHEATEGNAAVPAVTLCDPIEAKIKCQHTPHKKHSSPTTQKAIEEDVADDQLLETLLRLGAQYDTYDILLTGHSLGGGIAVLFAVMLQHRRLLPPGLQRRVRVVAFAAMPTLTLAAAQRFDSPTIEDFLSHDHSTTPSPPPPPGEQNAQTNKEKEEEEEDYPIIPILTIVNGCDVVPRLQLNSIDRLCTALEKDLEKERKREEKRNKGPTPSSRRTPWPPRFTALSPGEDGSGGMGSSITSGEAVLPVATAVDANEDDEEGEEMAELTADGAALPSSTTDAAETLHRHPEDKDVFIAVPESVDPAASVRSCDSTSSTNASGITDLTDELHHPGRVLLLTTPWEPSTNRLVELPRGHVMMHEIFLMKPMLEMHMVDSYAAALRVVKFERER